MKSFVVLACCLVVVSARYGGYEQEGFGGYRQEGYGGYRQGYGGGGEEGYGGYGQQGFGGYGGLGGHHHHKTNIASQQSNANAGDGGVAIASGNANAGLNNPGGFGGRGGMNLASQVSNANAGDNGVATSSGSASAGREKRTVVVLNAPTSRVVPIVPIVKTANQDSVAITANGGALATGSAAAMREKRDFTKLSVTGLNPQGRVNMASGTVVSQNGPNTDVVQETSHAAVSSSGAAVASGTVVV